jgi:hypothetical protein
VKVFSHRKTNDTSVLLVICLGTAIGSLAALLSLEDFLDASVPCPLLLAFLLKQERKIEKWMSLLLTMAVSDKKNVQLPVIKLCTGNSLKP